ncbi:MAG: DUF4954 family protein [Spirochaetia bacterium]|nr:DUF4954 family protein [Spirochaetia bacterium]
MNDIQVHGRADLGYGFVPPAFLPDGQDEFYLRRLESGKADSEYRRLGADEIAALERNGNRAVDWSTVLVSDRFDAGLVRNSEFAGLVRIGRVSSVALEHHDMVVPVGITSSRLVSCDVGDDCAIHSCAYIAHYLIGDGCILLNNDEIHVTNHAKWGNGIIKDGETEDLRVWLDLMNEAGGRSVLPFESMICADAWLWAKRREDGALMDRFRGMTQACFETRRGEYGVIGPHSVIKSNRIIKDVRVGACAYIKGANKLKNLTIRSSDAERTQIGEGVELVNGIVGYGCRIFYGCKAVRFVMGSNSALKYGARLIHSVLGDNSTVSCCEMLNNLVFPAHEQHHNTSFLVAAVVRGQSNMAAGATVGSNHNSRSNDGEIDAGRGFWPGLSTSVKHSSRFASYCLLAKGDYRFELDVPFPFALVADDPARDRLELMPAYWWMYNMYALIRNEDKFASRDRRKVKVQRVEFSPFAPDTAEEMFGSLALLERLVGEAWYAFKGDAIPEPAEARERGRALLAGSKEDVDALDVRAPGVENSRRAVVVLKPRRAYKAYRHMLRWYAVRTLLDYFEERPDLGFQDAAEVLEGPRVRDWENLGGQLVPREKVEALVSRVKSGQLACWDNVHAEYERLWAEYPLDKAQHAWATLAGLCRTERLEAGDLARETAHFMETTRFVEEQIYLTRRKDYTNAFRKATFRDDDEMRAVLSTPESSPFVRQARLDMERLRSRADALLVRLGPADA